MRGKDITIPKGTEIPAYIDGDREIALSSLPPGASFATSNAVQSGSVLFKSDPDGADILVDGKFLGTTPSNAQLTPGDHSVAIAKPHFETWKRTISISAGSSANVSASLEKSQ